MDAAYPVISDDELQRHDEATNLPSQPTASGAAGSGSIDLNAQFAAVSSSLWGWAASATATIKKTTATVVSEVKRDFTEFSQQLSEENKELLRMPDDPASAATTTAPAAPIPLTFSSPSPSTSGSSVSSPTSSSDLSSSLTQSVNSVSSDPSLTSSASGDDWSSKVMDGVERIGDDVLNRAINMLPSALWSFGGAVDESPEQSQSSLPPAASLAISTHSANSTPNPAAASAAPTSYTPASVKHAKLAQMESSVESYTTDPVHPSTNQPSAEFAAFRRHFHTDYETMWREELDSKVIPGASQVVRDMYASLVRDDASVGDSTHPTAKDFWCRYIFRVRLIEAEEARRLALLGKISGSSEKPVNTEQEDSWGSEGEEEEEEERKKEQDQQAKIPERIPEVFTPIPSPSPPVPSLPAITSLASPQSSPVHPSISPPVPVSVPSPAAATPAPEPNVEPSLSSTSSSSLVPAAGTTSAKRPPETKEAMRARLEREAKERVAAKLAEGKARKVASIISSAVAESSASSSSIPPIHPSGSNTQNVDQIAKLSEGFSDVITKSVPTNTTPEPLKRRLAAEAAASVASFSSAPSQLAGSTAAATIDFSSPSPPLSSSSRSSSGTSVASADGWQDVTQTTAEQTKATQPAAVPTASATAVTSASTKPNADDDWDEWS